MADDAPLDGTASPRVSPSRPATAQRIPGATATGPRPAADQDSDGVPPSAASPDAQALVHGPPPQHEAAASVDSSQIETTAVDETRVAEETLSEEAVHRHLNDVESSFLPALSPAPSGSAAGPASDPAADGASPLPSTPAQLALRPAPRGPDVDATAVSLATSSPAPPESSPASAAAARTMSRAASRASGPAEKPAASQRPDQDDAAHALLLPPDRDDPSASLSRAQSATGSSVGPSLRPSKRSGHLRSRHSSERSSTSSLVTNPDSHQDSEATVGLGLDYALQSGGAVSALAVSRRPSNMLPRSTSIGSMASGFAVDDSEPSLHQLEPLTEIDSRPQTRSGDLVKTPKPLKENIATAPTDTVIAQHVKNVHVPESLAKEYKFKNGLQTPRRPPSLAAAAGTAGRGGRNLTLKEQSNTIERLSKENFDLKLKVMFLSDRLDKLSEEGIKEMISENVDLKTSLAVLQRDNRVLRRRVKELERQTKDDDARPGTARSATSSAEQTPRLDDDEMQGRKEEIIYLRERVEEYALEIERLRHQDLHRESDKRKMAEAVKALGERAGDTLGRQEEADVWKDLLEQETARREQADEENRRLRDDVFRLKREASNSQGGAGGALHHTTNIYNITKKPRDRNASPSRPLSRTSGDLEGSNANFSSATTLVEELRRESEQLRHENAELRREVGAQTSMLTSRNREKERLYQEIEDLKMAQRRGGGGGAGSGSGGGGPVSAVDSFFERSASRAGHERPISRGSAKTKHTFVEEDPEREELENKLAELRDRLSEVKLHNQELQRELETCMEDIETAVEDKRQTEDMVVSLQEELETAINDLVALQAERDEALREQDGMEADFETLCAEAQREIDTLEDEADQRNEEVQRLQVELRDRSENLDALQEEMRKLSEALVRLEDEQEAKLQRIKQLEDELDGSNKELEELEQKFIESSDKTQRLTVQQESSQGEIAFLREEQEADKVRIGDLEAALAHGERSLREERERAKELDARLQQERVQREVVANREKEEVQQFVNELNREASATKDEVRRLRKSLSSREVEATEWKERLIELENNLREALGDLNGTRSSLLKSIAKMQRELENTIRELDTSKAALVEKDRIIKQRDALLESHALESRKVAELLDKERVAHRNTKSQFDTFQKTHHHLSQTASTQDVRIAELESTRGQDRRKIAMLEQTTRDQLTERNQLLLTLWQKLSALCGREWLHGNALVDRQVVPSVEVIANRLPGFSKNLLAAIRTIEAMFGSLQTKIRSVERDLVRDYQTLENNLGVRIKKLDRLEAMVRNSVASAASPSGSLDAQERMMRLENAYRQLKVENATLKTAQDVRSRVAKPTLEGALVYRAAGGSPSPSILRGPVDQDRSRSARPTLERNSRSAGANLAAGSGIPRPAPAGGAASGSGMDVALAGEADGANDNRWLFRLRDMESKLKKEREGRNRDRQAARQRLGALEVELRSLQERLRRQNSETV